MTSSSDPGSRDGQRHTALFGAPAGKAAGGAADRRAPDQSAADQAARFADKLRKSEPAPKPGAYSRFIPREELKNGFAAWQPGSFGDDPSRKPQTVPDPALVKREAEAAVRREAQRVAAAAAQAESDRIEELRRAREGGYTDGHRDGLAAMDAFRQSFSSQATAQVTAVVQALNGQIEALEQELAQRITGIALELARQVVRSEIALHPERVVAVAQEALGVLLMSARHVTLRLHPDDQRLVAMGCGEQLAARQVRLVPDAQIERGGCRVESDIGVVEAEVSTRWQRASAALGRATPWAEPVAAEADPRQIAAAIDAVVDAVVAATDAATDPATDSATKPATDGPSQPASQAAAEGARA
jgi:flagellar assembly protein FliH